MKKPTSKTAKGTKERAQAKAKGTGVNKPMQEAKVPQVAAKTTYGKPSQRQKM